MRCLEAADLKCHHPERKPARHPRLANLRPISRSFQSAYDCRMSASSELRHSTAAAHRALEQTPVAKNLASGRIEHLTYVDYLRAIAVVVANLRTAIKRSGSPVQRQLLPVLDDWSTRIGNDIHQLAPDETLANPDAQTTALALVQKLYLKIADDPAWVFGVAYVLFGSHNGNRSIADAVSRDLAVSGDTGTSYLRATQGDGAAWHRFKILLDQNLEHQEAIHSATGGALATFECFHGIFDALQNDDGRSVHATAINPEAGNHPVPLDDRLSHIANEVGRNCHAAFGYLCRRYGSRGEAFARSDGVWLVTLCEIPSEQARKRIDWLSRLLSARGIPSLCLEHHLDMLHEALVEEKAIPGQDSDRLLQLARHVGSNRSAAVPPDQWQAIIQIPLPALDPLGAATLVSAVIDQRSGLAACADSIVGWLETTNDLQSRDRSELRAFLDSVRD